MPQKGRDDPRLHPVRFGTDSRRKHAIRFLWKVNRTHRLDGGWIGTREVGDV